MGEQPKQQDNKRTYLGAGGTTKDPEFSKWTLDPVDIAHFIELMLKGAVFKTDEKGILTYVIDKDKQKLNEKGRSIIMATIRAIFHRGQILSDYDAQQISIHTMTLHKKLVVALLKNWRDVGVSSPADITKIVYENVSMNVFATLNRAKGGTTWKKLSELHVVKTDISANQRTGGTSQGSPIAQLFSGGGMGGG